MCADQSKVCGYHRFQQAEFSPSVLAELRVLFESCSELLHQKVVLHAYTALLSRLQVESYLHRLLKGGTLRRLSCVGVTVKEGVKLLIWSCICFSDYSGSPSQPCSLQPLKEAISVLFSFTRRVLDDTQLQTDIHQWLERLVNTQHQASNIITSWLRLLLLVWIFFFTWSCSTVCKVIILLHVGGSEEHFYLLCHLLCCPAGVGKWATPFLQVK